MGFNGDILVLNMGLAKMIILGRGWINWLGSWILLKIIQPIGGLSCLLGIQRVSPTLLIIISSFAPVKTNDRPPINGLTALPHVLSILRYPPLHTRIKTKTILPNVSTIMRPRPRRTIQYRFLRPINTHDSLHDRYRTT
jgi:hypothetical protein